MDFNALQEEVNSYLDRLEKDFLDSNTDLYFIEKKLERYTNAFHEDVIYQLTEDDNINYGLHEKVCTVRDFLVVPHSESTTSYELELRKKYRSIREQIYNFDNEFKKNYIHDLLNTELISIGSNQSQELKKTYYLEIKTYLKPLFNNFCISINHSPVDKLLHEIAEEVTKNKMRDESDWITFRKMKHDKIEHELISIFMKEQTKNEIRSIFNDYRIYIGSCIEKYREILDGSLACVDHISPQHLNKNDIIQIEIGYQNGDKRLLSFEHLCTAEDIHSLEHLVSKLITLSGCN